MNYFYDLILSFHDTNYKFYELECDDVFEKVSKIPIYKVSNKVFKDIITYNIKVNDTFLNSIHNKTILKSNKYLEYACLLADKNNVIALEFDRDGKSISRSLIPIEDELNILDVIYTINLCKLEYINIDKMANNNILRKESKIKKIIELELNKLKKEHNIEKISFLYLEWFGHLKENYQEMLADMYEKLKGEISVIEEKIVDIIKMSYNKV